MRNQESSGRRTQDRSQRGGVHRKKKAARVGVKLLARSHSGRMVAARASFIMVCALGGSTAAGASAGEGIPSGVTAEASSPVGSSSRVVSPAVVAAQELAALPAVGADQGVTESYIAALSVEVIEALGYSPVIVDGLPADPEGDCSSPMPLPESFTPACLTHDLGYDLLRVADATGEHIPSGVRFALDQQLGARMTASCGGGVVGRTSCKAMAGVADSAVKANTWRQGEGAPVEEKWPWT